MTATKDPSEAELSTSQATQSDLNRWAFVNTRLEEGQADDRQPMNGSVADSGGTASEQRALARKSHLLMHKKWSQERHE